MAQTVALHTLGCKLNFSETASISRMLENEGFIQKDFNEVADLYVINTCSVTDNADKECRQLIRRITRRAPDAMVVITGCYAQLKPAEISEIPGVNLVLGAAEKFNIVQHLKELSPGDKGKICSCEIEHANTFTASYSLGQRTRAFLKVQDGCDYNCSFCTIPLARGKSRSDTIDKVLKEIEEIVASGIKEIVLTGINLGDFGKGFTGRRTREETFFELLEEIDAKAPVERVRISSIEPNLLHDSIIRLVANSNKLMPHFHIPLQSGSDRILSLMRRRYKRELFEEKIREIRSRIPQAGIGADVIVGFPGETEQDFNDTVDFVSALPLTYLHVFTYSERENTIAAGLPGAVPGNLRSARNNKLRTISYNKSGDFAKKNVGLKRPVLFESVNKNGMMEGYTDNYIKVSVPFNKEWENKIVEWQL